MVIKKIVLLGVILFLLSLNPVSANEITLNQDWGRVAYWDDHKYVLYHDAYVGSHLRLSLSHIFYNYSNNYTFEFSPFEPSYTGEPLDFKIRVFKNCEQVGLRELILEPHIRCERGWELEEGIDFQDIEIAQDDWEQKAHQISIFQNKSIKESVYYDILISYQLENAVQSKGMSRYFPYTKRCISRGNQDKCPTGASTIEYILLADPDLKLIDPVPENANRRISNIGMEYYWVEGVDSGGTIWFSSIRERELLIPFVWAVVPAIISFVLGLMPFIVSKRGPTGKKYYCTKCKRVHYRNKKTGKNHIKYKLK